MKAKNIKVKGMACGIHLPCEVEVSLLTNDLDHVELITGAFEGYLNSIGCTMCAAEAINSDLDTYVSIFIDKFIPIISNLDIKAKINLVNLKPLSYG